MNNEDYRRAFFKQYLAMFDGLRCEITAECPNIICARVWWTDCPDEAEDVRWHVSVSDVPDDSCYQLVSFIASRHLLEIDRLQLSRRQLFEQFSASREADASYREFERALDALLSVSLPCFENDERVDSLFVHE